MGFLSPSLPESDPLPVEDDTEDSTVRNSELAIQRARRAGQLASRRSLIVNPNTNSGGDNGLAVRR